MDKLILMKELLGIDSVDNSKDNTLNHFLNKSRSIIISYCNVPEMAVSYDCIIVDFATHLYKNRNNIGLIKKIEGERSASFEVGIPENIKLALPLPRIKVGAY